MQQLPLFDFMAITGRLRVNIAPKRVLRKSLKTVA